MDFNLSNVTNTLSVPPRSKELVLGLIEIDFLGGVQRSKITDQNIDAVKLFFNGEQVFPRV